MAALLSPRRPQHRKNRRTVSDPDCTDDFESVPLVQGKLVRCAMALPPNAWAKAGKDRRYCCGSGYIQRTTGSDANARVSVSSTRCVSSCCADCTVGVHVSTTAVSTIAMVILLRPRSCKPYLFARYAGGPYHSNPRAR